MAGELQIALGHNLRLIRERDGLSQEAFAERMGVHRTYWGSLERGERNVSLRSLEQLASALSVPPLDLLAEQA